MSKDSQYHVYMFVSKVDMLNEFIIGFINIRPMIKNKMN